MKRNKGQASIAFVTVLSIVSMTASTVAAFFIPQLTVEQKFSDFNKNVAVVTTQESDHYKELAKSIDELKDSNKTSQIQLTEILKEIRNPRK